MANLKECTNCSATAHTPEAKFCYNCGVKVMDWEVPFCACGYDFGKWDKYCPQCGRQKPKGRQKNGNV